MIKIM